MGNVKKILGSACSLATVSVVLVIALTALFITNTGFGWFSENRHSYANVIMPAVTAPDSPVESFMFYQVENATPDIVKGTENEDEYVHNQYTFAPLGYETAQLEMKDYSKLSAPRYHILLHVVFKPGIESVWLDTHIEGEEYELMFTDIPVLVASDPPVPLGMSAVLEFYVLDPQNVERETVTNNSGDGGEETWFIFDDINLPAESHKFDRTDIKNKDGELTGYAYGGMDDVLLDLTNSNGEAGEEEQYELFLFITYNAERISFLQECAGFTDSEEGEEEDDSVDSGNIAFRSDFFIFFRRDT